MSTRMLYRLALAVGRRSSTSMRRPVSRSASVSSGISPTLALSPPLLAVLTLMICREPSTSRKLGRRFAMR